jgi:hydroxymethylbilane synthase
VIGWGPVTDRVRIGTRGSRLALRQAEEVAAGLRKAWAGIEVELVPIRTSGDRLATAHLAQVGGKGLFVKEIDEALLEERVDLAVHSLKDLPAERPKGVALAAFPPREDPRDALVAPVPTRVDALRRGARVGTSSLRRRVQLLARRPDVTVGPVRGNVDSRLRRLRQGEFDALVLASAGLRRLGLLDATATVLDADEMVPAVGQGTLAVETREEDDRTRRLAEALTDAGTRTASLAERAFLEAVGGSCATPLAAYARLTGAGLRLDVFLATPDGARSLRDGETGDPDAPEALGRRLATRCLAAGAAEIIRAGEVA